MLMFFATIFVMRNRTRWEMLATSTAWLLDFPSCKLLQALEFCFCFCNWLLITFFIFHFSRKQSRVGKGKNGRRETGGGRLWGNHNSSNVAGILTTFKYIYRDVCIYMCIYIHDLKQFRTGRGSPSVLWLPQFYCLAAKKLNTISLFIFKPFLISLCKT